MIQIRIDKFLNNVINFFTRFIRTIVDNSLFSRCFIWSSQVRFSSIMTPKHLYIFKDLKIVLSFHYINKTTNYEANQMYYIVIR